MKPRQSGTLIFFLSLILLSCSTCRDDAKVVEISKGGHDQQSLYPDPEQIPEYQFNFGDEMDIVFFDAEEYNQTIVVRPDGRISLPAVGELFVVGMTPQELAGRVKEVYTHVLKAPDVSVQVKSFQNRTVFVMGEIERPGRYDYVYGSNVLQMIAQAGGFKDTADYSSVVVARPEDGGITHYLMNLEGVRDGVQEISFPLKPQDMILVPSTTIARLDIYMDQYFVKFIAPPLDLALRGYFYIESIDRIIRVN
ncbi:MAG: polysaccharide export protein [Planctomycetes bacterium]|nr:polysaccharide export protein [Planctomycetota bacterium]